MNPLIRGTLLAVVGGVLTTVMASSLMGINSHLRDMHTDIRVTQVLLLEHKEQHVVLELQVRNNTDRLYTAERDLMVLESTNKYYHGKAVMGAQSGN